MLLIGGLQKLSLIDYPGKVAAVVFTQGCNFRCPFCHNRELVIPSEFHAAIPEEEVTSFLLQRRDKIQGVVVTGGEPTIQPELIPFLKKVKGMGFCVKLDTNASRPDVIAGILQEKLVDFFAVDVKAPLERYADLAGVKVNAGDIQESFRRIIDSGVDHLFRTTVVKPLFVPEDFERISRQIAGARRYILQEFVVREKVLDPGLFDKGQYSEPEFLALRQRWEIA